MLKILFFILAVSANIYLAKKKNRSTIVWVIFGFYSYFLSTIILFFLKPRPKGKLNLAPHIIFWPFFLIFSFSNLPLIGVTFHPIPPEILTIFLWIIAYSWFLVNLWKKEKSNFVNYIIAVLIPLLFAIIFCSAVCFIVRAPFRDGIKTISKLEEYKRINGKYPANLPSLKDNSYDSYYYNADKNSFTLSYMIGLFEFAWYHSDTKKWQGDYPVGGVPYDIIGLDQIY